MNYQLFLDIETVPRFEPEDEFPKKWLKQSRTKKIIQQMSLDPNFCKIIAIGYKDRIDICLDGMTESKILERFWDSLEYKLLITFNGKGFDLPVIIRRSQLLGVPIIHNIYKYLSRNINEYHIDIMDILNISDRSPRESKRTQEFYMDLFNCKTEKFGDGEYIYDWYKQNNWEAIKKHCQADINGLIELYNKILGG